MEEDDCPGLVKARCSREVTLAGQAVTPRGLPGNAANSKLVPA